MYSHIGLITLTSLISLSFLDFYGQHICDVCLVGLKLKPKCKALFWGFTK